MINTYACPSCNGRGCSNCNNIGYFGRDESNDYYLGRDGSGNIVVAGVKQGAASGGNFIGKLLFSLIGAVFSGLKEPKDFIWGAGQRGARF